LVMSDLDESGVTYTEVFSLFEGLSDIGSPRADDHEYLELPGMQKDLRIGMCDDEIVAEGSAICWRLPLPTTQLLDYVQSRLRRTRRKDDMRAEAASTSHSLLLPPLFILPPTRLDAQLLGIPPPLPISVPTSSLPLLLPSVSHRKDRPEVTLPPRKRLSITLGPRYEVGESLSAAAARPARGLRADYGFVATIDREIRRDLERVVGYGITNSWDEIVETL
ncbi:hypothetical protein Tco_1189753, partial [Tanacetum coccineum]